MNSCPQELELKEAVERLEKALLTPVLSGELVQWVSAVQDATEDLDGMLPFLEGALHADYSEIAKADNELLSRVEQMVGAEKNFLEQKEDFRRCLHHLAEWAPHVHSDEARVADERLKVERKGVELLTELKRLQTAASTWLQEAVYRDRGPVD
jgi:hypothetical protein